MSFVWNSLYSGFASTLNYLVDPPGEENPENSELAITGEKRGATVTVIIITIIIICTFLYRHKIASPSPNDSLFSLAPIFLLFSFFEHKISEKDIRS